MATIPNNRIRKKFRKNRKQHSNKLKIELPSRIGDQFKERFYYDLHTLLEAGADIIQSLEILQKNAIKESRKTIIVHIKSSLVKGGSLYTALQSRKEFSQFETISIQIGEESGQLPRVLHSLHEYYKERIALRRMLFEALSYPMFILFTTLFIVGFMLVVVVPMFQSMFDRMGAELPDITKLVISLSDFLSNSGVYVLLAIFGLLFLLFRARKNRKMKGQLQYIFLRLPYLGNLQRRGQTYRWTQIMQLMIESFMPLEQALQLSNKMITFEPLNRELEKIRMGIHSGIHISDTMEKSTFFDRGLVAMIQVGEETNKLADMFARLNAQQKEQIQFQTKLVSKILEPLMIVLIGILVGFILVAMYLPLFELSTVVG